MDPISTSFFHFPPFFSQPKRWKEALFLGVHEAARLAEWGVSEGEMLQVMSRVKFSDKK